MKRGTYVYKPFQPKPLQKFNVKTLDEQSYKYIDNIFNDSGYKSPTKDMDIGVGIYHNDDNSVYGYSLYLNGVSKKDGNHIYTVKHSSKGIFIIDVNDNKKQHNITDPVIISRLYKLFKALYTLNQNKQQESSKDKKTE